MKNKTFFLFVILFVMICISAFAGGSQDYLDTSSIDMIQLYIETGSLDKIIPNTLLSMLAKDDLQLLRNAIYARHGMTFQSNYLSEYFKKYDWYKPVSRNVESKLSETDRTNIKNIQVFENAKPNPNLRKNQLVGRWVDQFPVSAYCGEIKFNNNNTIEINDLLFEGSVKGKYTIENGFLIVTVIEIYDNSNERNYNSSKDRWLTLPNPYRLVLPVSDLKEAEYEGYRAYQVKIGFTTWFGGPDR